MIYVTGDCHGNFARFEQKHFPELAIATETSGVSNRIVSRSKLT